MKVTITEIRNGEDFDSETLVFIENRDFSVASFNVMDDLHKWGKPRFTVDVMLDWFQNNGNTDFSITHTHPESSLTYRWEYTA